MDYRAVQDVPQFYLENPDMVRMLNVFQRAYDLMYEDTSGITLQMDYRTAEEKYIDLMLIESGWYPKITLSLYTKRKILKIIQNGVLYEQKGLTDGIQYAIREVTGLNVITVDKTSAEGFRLNDNQLGVDTYLGLEGVFFYFVVYTPTLTPEQLAIVTEVIDFMRWAVTTYIINQSL